MIKNCNQFIFLLVVGLPYAMPLRSMDLPAATTLAVEAVAQGNKLHRPEDVEAIAAEIARSYGLEKAFIRIEGPTPASANRLSHRTTQLERDKAWELIQACIPAIKQVIDEAGQEIDANVNRILRTLVNEDQVKQLVENVTKQAVKTALKEIQKAGQEIDVNDVLTRNDVPQMAKNAFLKAIKVVIKEMKTELRGNLLTREVVREIVAGALDEVGYRIAYYPKKLARAIPQNYLHGVIGIFAAVVILYTIHNVLYTQVIT